MSAIGRFTLVISCLSVLLCGSGAQAQSYGPSITLDVAKQVLSMAQQEARRNNLHMAVAIVDTAGNLVAFERLDDTQSGSIEVAQDKARSAALYRRSTKVFQDALAAGGNGLRILTLRGVSAADGGEPIVVNGKVIGAIGVSGGSSDQDGMVARAGLTALK